jgi:hypothetical protein
MHSLDTFDAGSFSAMATSIGLLPSENSHILLPVFVVKNNQPSDFQLIQYRLKAVLLTIGWLKIYDKEYYY